MHHSLLILVLVVFAFITPAHAQGRVGLGEALFHKQGEEMTLVSACHKDGSLTLTRITMEESSPMRRIPVRSTMRVAAGDKFQLYRFQGGTSVAGNTTLVSVKDCVGEFTTLPTASR
jgi:hypothetical protein